MDDDGTVDVVRRGYDRLSLRYRADDDAPAEYEPWIARLVAELPAGARVLDVGCGCGVPVAARLAAAGHRMTGVDVSDVQIGRARRLVPAATFVRADALEVDLPARSFDAVVALYSVIHVPLASQPRLLGRFAEWLVDGGTLLMTAGQDAWTGSDAGWLGGDAEMRWSHADAATYRRWLITAGIDVLEQGFVPEGSGGHSLFRARRRPREQFRTGSDDPP